MSRRAVLGAALLYLAAILCVFRSVLPVATTSFPYATYLDEIAPRWRGAIHSDQKLSAVQAAHNARLLVSEPWNIMDGHQCFPVQNATTLGEHMIGPGLRAVVPYVLTGDPILTYNVVLLSTHWIAGMAMYALVFYWTRSVPAALVAGFLFALQPLRLTDTSHPYTGMLWTPLALLLAHRLFARERWRDAFGLALVIGLQFVEGAYPSLTLALLGGVYGCHLLYAHRARVLALLPKLGVCALLVGMVAAWVLLPYAETRTFWTEVGGRGKVLYPISRYLWGAQGYPGTAVVVLAIIAIADRVRRRSGAGMGDPRLALLLAGLVTLWAAVARVPVFGWSVPSLFVLLSDVVPGFDLVRVGGATEVGVGLVGAFLAGYGVFVLVGRRARTTRALVSAVVLGVVALEVLVPPLARLSFGRTTEIVPYQTRPHAKLLGLYEVIDDGAVLDIPLESNVGSFSYLGQYVWLGAFHRQPVASCYNSFRTGVQMDVEDLARRVHVSQAAGHALFALGFRTVVVHVIVPGRRRPPPIVPLPRPPHLVEIGRTFTHTVYRLQSDARVESSFDLLRHVGSAEIEATAGAPTVRIPLTNHGDVTYRHPEPIVPTMLTARWYDPAGMLVEEATGPVLLPLALAAGATTKRAVPLTVPAPVGHYRLALVHTAEPERVLADVGVRVVAAEATP